MIRRRLSKAPKQLHPKLIEAQYRLWIAGLVKRLKEEVRRIVFPYIDTLNQRADAAPVDDNWAVKVDDLIRQLKASFGYAFEERKLKSHILTVGRKTALWNDKEWRKVLKGVLSIDTFKTESWLDSRVKSFVNTNTDLITKLSTDTLTEVRRVVESGIRGGKTTRSIKENLIAETGLRGLENVPWLQKVENRAKLIARDQISKFNGELTKQRQESLGLGMYIWHTVEDEAVRESHAVLDGVLCKWDDSTIYSDDLGKTWKSRDSIGAFVGDPGEDYLCRCFAEPYFVPGEWDTTEEGQE
jgi:uncharacterized protein with gpF-like domain